MVEKRHEPLSQQILFAKFDKLNGLFQGTVLIKTAQELLDFSKGEEKQVEEVRLNIHISYIKHMHVQFNMATKCSCLKNNANIGDFAENMDTTKYANVQFKKISIPFAVYKKYGNGYV